MTVLILAEEADIPVDMAVTELAARGVPVFRADTSWFPQKLVLEGTVDVGGRFEGELRTENHRVDLAAIRSIWSRGPGAFRFTPHMTAATRMYAHREARLGLGGVLADLDLDARWVNHPNRSANSSYKPVQLGTAARCGLTIPRTLFTNDPEAAARFVTECPDGVVHKSMGPNTVTTEDQIEVAFTHRLQSDDLEDDLSAVALTATQLQAWIEKKHDARVIVVGDRMFSIAIRANSSASQVDWRADYQALSYEWIDTPTEVAEGLRHYVDKLDLSYAAADFVIDKTGRWIFLESNAAGQYYWLEANTGAPITAALCDVLSATR